MAGTNRWAMSDEARTEQQRRYWAEEAAADPPHDKTWGIRFPRSRRWQIIELLFAIVLAFAVPAALIYGVTALASVTTWAFIVGVLLGAFVGYQFGRSRGHAEPTAQATTQEA